MLPASASLASCGHLRPCKLPWMQVCFLGLRAFSTLWQSVDFVNILGERACTAPPFAIFRGCAARAEKALAFFRALWYTIPCSTGDDDRVPCGVMLRIVSGPEGSSTKQKLARAAGYAWSESVGFSFGRKMPPLPKHGGGAFSARPRKQRAGQGFGGAQGFGGGAEDAEHGGAAAAHARHARAQRPQRAQGRADLRHQRYGGRF